jgi:hypothetical protein
LNHVCCRNQGSYSVRVGGVLSADGFQHTPTCLVMQPDGRWRVTADPAVDTPVIDLTGTFVAPALYDAHVHLYQGVDVAAFLRYGISRIRDLGSCSGLAVRFARHARCAAQPEVIYGGPVLDKPGRPRLDSAYPWNEQKDLLRFIQRAVALGASWLKVYAKFPRPVLPLLVSEAHLAGLRVAAHARPSDVRTVLGAGVDELEHLAPLVGTIRPTTHHMGSVFDAWSASMDEAELASLSALFGDASLCPTLVVHQKMIDIAGYGRYPGDADAALLKSWTRFAITSARWSREETDIAHRAFDNMKKTLAWLHECGVAITIGSDTPNPGVLPGVGLWDEINLLVSAGLPPHTAYLLASVSPGGPGMHGDGDLAFLPRSSMPGAHVHAEWLVRPVTAVTRQGCLFTSDNRERAS